MLPASHASARSMVRVAFYSSDMIERGEARKDDASFECKNCDTMMYLVPERDCFECPSCKNTIDINDALAVLDSAHTAMWDLRQALAGGTDIKWLLSVFSSWLRRLSR